MKKRNLYVVICACIISLSLCAYANENGEVNSEGVETVESVVETTDEVTAKNMAKTVEETVEVETAEKGVSEENTSDPQSVGEWAISLDTTEPKLTVWNNICFTRRIIDDKSWIRIL